MIRKIIAMVVVFFVFLGYCQAKTITINGDADDWVVTPDTGTMSVNSAIVRDGEWIWKDTSNDERRNTIYYKTGGETPSCDITEVRITADDVADKLYFLVKFKDLDLGTTGVSYPFVQVAIDCDKDVGLELLPLSNDENDLARISDSAGWEYLVYAYQNDVAVLVNDIIPGGSVIDPGNYSQYASTNPATSPYFMEFSVPFSNLGGSTHYLGKTVTFSLVCFFHSAAWTGGVSHKVRPFESGFSHIIDCVSLIDAPELTQESDGAGHSGTAGTWEEVSDNVVDTYFDVKFSAAGDVVVNNKPTLGVPTFKVDDLENNREVVVEGRNPFFSWEGTFSDVDAGDSQKAVQVEVDLDDVDLNDEEASGNEIWTSSPVLESSNSIQYSGSTALAVNQVYYWNVRVMDNHGEWGDWIKAGSFSTIKQARPFNTAKNNLSIDWNNPFNPAKGDYTKIRYIVEKDKHVVIRIYDMSGKLIKTLVDDDKLNNVVYTQVWDGRNEEGKLVASGVYFVNIKSGNFTKTEKIVVIK